jgi:hypothetical protein
MIAHMFTCGCPSGGGHRKHMFLATAGKLVVNQLMERNTTMATTAKAMSTEELKWTMVMCEVILCPSTPDSMR